MRAILRLLVVTVAATTIACNPVSPGECHDPYGRGPIVDTAIKDCHAIGADLQCSAFRTEAFYCAGPDQNVTLTAAWTSSNLLLAAFGAAGTSPGYLKTLAMGSVQVTAAYGGRADTRGPFFVSPGSGPQQEATLDVSVTDAATNGKVSNAIVEVRPQDGATQSCETDLSGMCKFTKFRVLVGGTIDLTVLKVGYQTAHRLIENCTGCGVTVPLTHSDGRPVDIQHVPL